MKLSKSEQIKLTERVISIQKDWVQGKSYTAEYIKEYGKRKSNVDVIRNVWNYKALSKHIDVIENLEKLSQKLKNAE